MRSLRAATVGILFVLGYPFAAAPVSAAPCGAHVGERIFLASNETDPDVFVWDTRERLGEFSSDRWGSFSVIMAHTVLVRPGTRAVVTRCEIGGAHDRRSGASRDAIGIYLASGRYRGRSGWVSDADAHLGAASPVQARR